MFALGCVIAYAAGGAGPFGTGTAAAVLYRVVHGEAVLDRVPPALREIVSRCLAKDPAARPAAAALAAELAGRDRGTGPSAVAFWPRQVAGVLGAYQARLEQEAGEPGRPAEVFSPAGATHPATAAAWPPGPQRLHGRAAWPAGVHGHAKFPAAPGLSRFTAILSVSRLSLAPGIQPGGCTRLPAAPPVSPRGRRRPGERRGLRCRAACATRSG